MGKKNPTVSIVTITQLKRFPCLEILKDMIKAGNKNKIARKLSVKSFGRFMHNKNKQGIASMAKQSKK